MRSGWWRRVRRAGLGSRRDEVVDIGVQRGGLGTIELWTGGSDAPHVQLSSSQLSMLQWVAALGKTGVDGSTVVYWRGIGVQVFVWRGKKDERRRRDEVPGCTGVGNAMERRRSASS